MSRAAWLELCVLTALGAALAAWSMLGAGEWAWSWDALNHHIYLGLIAQSPRWHLDVLAASVQGYQYPYLYWPVYWLSTLQLPAVYLGALWAAVQASLLIPPVWLASFYLLPTQGPKLQVVFERSMAVVLAASSIVLMAGVGTTSNDLLAGVPLMWAFALMCAPDGRGVGRSALAAALWGVSTAFKWSNGLAVPLLIFWCWQGTPLRFSWRHAFSMVGAAPVGFILAYAPWGWQLWLQTGNPFHPLFNSFFPPLVGR